MTDSLSLRAALKNTENIEAPAVSFIKPSSITGHQALSTTIIKQNNTQIQLLATIADNLVEIKQDLKILLNNQPIASTLPEDLITKLKNLSLGPKETPKQVKGTLKVFKDPYQIAREEKEKARLHYNF